MTFVNEDFPLTYCKIRAEYLYDLTQHHGEYENVVVFGIASVQGRAVGFHLITEQGAQIARMPISALVSKPHPPHLPLHYLQLWDCFSYDVAVHQFSYLNLMRCQVILRDKQIFDGTYLATLDWVGNHESEDPGEGGHKNAHVIVLDCGCWVALPNNRIIWNESSFLTNTCAPRKGERPDYLTNSHVWKVEIDNKWCTEDSYKMFYDDKELDGGGLSVEQRQELSRIRALKDINHPNIEGEIANWKNNVRDAKL